MVVAAAGLAVVCWLVYEWFQYQKAQFQCIALASAIDEGMPAMLRQEESDHEILDAERNIPEDGNVIIKRGGLPVDVWGSRFSVSVVFRPDGAQIILVRSAGLDRTMGTWDDIVWDRKR